MNMYQTLQGILDKIRQNRSEMSYGAEEKEMLRGVLDNQERLSEAILILGGLLQALIEREISVQLIPDKDEKTH